MSILKCHLHAYDFFPGGLRIKNAPKTYATSAQRQAVLARNFAPSKALIDVLVCG